MNWVCAPTAIVAEAGETVRLLTVSVFTFTVAVLPLYLAVIVAEPAVELAVTCPIVAESLFPTVTILLSLDVQVAAVVTILVVLSVKVAVAINLPLVPVGNVRGVGEITSDFSAASVTVKLAVPLTEPRVALIVALPAFWAAAKPAVLIVATSVVLEAHTTSKVTFWVVESENVPVAAN